MMFKKYKLGFDIWGLILFFIIMIPNIYWMYFPTSNDLLRATSLTEGLDIIASVCRIVMVIAMMFIINKESYKISLSANIQRTIIYCLVYYLAWVFYYSGQNNGFTMISLCLFPCLAFISFILEKKNWIALIPAIAFTTCHLLYGFINFIL